MITNLSLHHHILILLAVVAIFKIYHLDNQKKLKRFQCYNMAEAEKNTTSKNVKDGYKAVLIGATGATGKYLFADLVKDKSFSIITVIGRRAATIPEDYVDAPEINLEEEVKSGRVQQVNDIDMNGEINKETFGKYFEGKDIFFSCFGTTRKAAGSAEEFRRIDFGINLELAKVAKESNVPAYSLMSSTGANSKSFFLYFQSKGELDEKTMALGFDHVSIWRPGLLDRGTSIRFVEKISSYVFHKIPVQAVAKAMRLDALQRLGNSETAKKGAKIFENAQIYEFCGLDNKGRKTN